MHDLKKEVWKIQLLGHDGYSKPNLILSSGKGKKEKKSEQIPLSFFFSFKFVSE